MPSPRLLWLLVALGLTAGCQRYQLEYVPPLAVVAGTQETTLRVKRFKPNLMLLVDKSGSMDLPIDPALPACGSCGSKTNPCNVVSCPTRWSELSIAVDGFLANNPTVARYGLAFFPEPQTDVCAPTSRTAVDVPPPGPDDSDATLQGLASAARNALATVRSQNAPGPTGTGGGTPTGASFHFFDAYAPLGDDQRFNFLLLLTDGLPNCNVDAAAQNGGCICTVSGPSCPATGCLDKAQTVAEIANLAAARSIQTVIVGFGAETGASDAAGTLEAMAEAGGYPRQCPGADHDQACGPGDGCVGGLCQRRFFQANDAASLGAALAQISASLGTKACAVDVSPEPSDASLISVSVNGARTESGPDTWAYLPPAQSPSGNPVVLFQGALCESIVTSSSQDPVHVEIRVLRIL